MLRGWSASSSIAAARSSSSTGGPAWCSSQDSSERDREPPAPQPRQAAVVVEDPEHLPSRHEHLDRLFQHGDRAFGVLDLSVDVLERLDVFEHVRRFRGRADPPPYQPEDQAEPVHVLQGGDDSLALDVVARVLRR